MRFEAENSRDRTDYFDLLDRQISRCSRNGTVLGLLIARVQRIRDINLTFGYEVGDELLAEVEAKLEQILRPTDIVARIGDNEFAMVLPEIRNQGHAILAANRIVQEFFEPLRLEQQALQMKVVVGVAVTPDHGADAEALMKSADQAVVQARTAPDRYAVHSSGVERASTKTLTLERQIEQALDNDELVLAFQPKIDLSSASVSGAEALIRWRTGSGELVSPASFIPVVEQSDLILPLTVWVLNTAMRQAATYRTLVPGFSVAVNLSPALLLSRDIIDAAEGAASIWGVPPGHVVLEVTEGAMMVDPERSLEILDQLHEIGFRLSIDDFGTGHSSLAYLQQLPVHELKVDQTFVLGMERDARNAAIVRTAIDIGHNFDLKVVAEGIETGAALDHLVALGCDYGQGYYISKPLLGEEFQSWLGTAPWASEFSTVGGPNSTDKPLVD
ncbi:MAG: phosphodiesterase [Gammaproteobacteria bacterium]|nr:phosphodiesterase [Gammaproteobacteria bacterium]